jgi:hypothetical protein
MAQIDGAPGSHEHDDHCVCDIDLKDDEITSDAELPAASGGVAAAAGEHPAEDSDGCDIDFNEAEPTADEELPAATGGVA